MISERTFLIFIVFLILVGCNRSEQDEKTVFLPDLKADLAKNNQKGKLIFTFASLAYTVDSDWGQGVPVEGMEKIAKVAHKYNIPVTWLIDPGSGKAMKNQLYQWRSILRPD